MTGEVNIEERLFQLMERFEQHEVEEEAKFDKLVKAQQNNAEAISEITRSVSQLVEDTGAIIQLHRDFQGAARIGKGLQGFLMWCMKWGTIGLGVATAIMWLVEHFSKHS